MLPTASEQESKHLEILNIRCFDQDIDHVLSHYIAPILRQKEVVQNWDIKIFKHYRIAMDIVISIINRNKDSKSLKSDLGIQLVENLKAFGIVNINHSVWEEIPF